MTVAHPLRQTLTRARLLSEYLKAEFESPAGEGFILAPGAFTPDSAQFEALIAATETRLRTTAPLIIASALLQSYQWPLISTAIACFLLDRRVPDLCTSNTLVRFNAEHEADTLRLLSGRFAALPADTAAQHPDARSVADDDALREYLRAGLECHLGAVVAQLCGRFGCKPRGLWLAAADSCAGVLIWLMQQHNPLVAPEQIEAEVAALLRAPGSPLATKQCGVLTLSHGGTTHVFHERATCCYYYKAAGGEYCATCPHRTRADRIARLEAYMAERHAERAGATLETDS